MPSKPFSVKLAGWFFLVFIVGSLTVTHIVALASPEYAAFVPTHLMFAAGLICGVWWLVGVLIYRWRLKRAASQEKSTTGN